MGKKEINLESDSISRNKEWSIMSKPTKSTRLCVFVAPDGIETGGTVTLSYRLGKGLQKRGYDIIYLTDSIASEVSFELFKSAGFNVIHEKRKRWNNVLEKRQETYQEIILITYYYYMYNAFPWLMHFKKHHEKKYNKVINVYLYAVLDYCLVIPIPDNSAFIKKIGIQLYNYCNKRYISDLYKNNYLIFMDKSTIEITEKYLGMQFPDYEEKLFPLPYCIGPKPSDIDNRKNIVITMARLDFPFKGYTIGLIDVYQYLKNFFPDLELWIIGSGEGRDLLQKKIDSCGEDIRKSIRLFGEVSYTDVQSIIRKCKVFVGMGTGVLDSAALAVPAIPVVARTYKCLGKSFFSDSPLDLGYSNELDMGSIHEVSDIIESVLRMDRKTYVELCDKEYTAVSNIYGLDLFIDRLLMLKNRVRGSEGCLANIMRKISVAVLSIYISAKKLFSA